MTSAPIIIIGAGQAGLQAAEALRAGGYNGELLMIGDEPLGPYHRPPLSKGMLLGETTPEQLVMRAGNLLESKGIQLATGVRVAAIDRAGQGLVLSERRYQRYSGLVLATGARLRSLPVKGAELDGVLGLRSLADAQKISAAMDATGNVAVIGGGFIGLEVAAAARKRGKTVTVFETANRLMARAVSPLVSRTFADLHSEKGVDLRFGAKVAALAGAHGRVEAVVTDDGREHRAGLVVVGVGVLANDGLAVGAGLTCDNGIIVDEFARTSDPHIMAAGDCTARRLPDGSLLRLESVQNAVEQGKSAAAALLGQSRAFTATPWFWSDQYDVKLQMVGLAAGYKDTVVRGNLKDRNATIFYYRGDKLIAVDTMNRPADHMAARKLLDGGISPTHDEAADGNVALSALATGKK